MKRAPLYSSTADEILSPEAIEEPQKIYARLREQHPLARIGDSGVHAVASWALIDEVLGREDDFSANLTGVLFRGPDGEPAVFPLATGGNAVIATADEPHHAVHRATAQPRLDARRTTTPEMEERVRGWTRRALAPWLDAGGGDAVPIAEVVPALAVAYLLGLPEADVADFRTWSMMGGDILAGEADHGRLTFLATESANMARYLARHFDVLDSPDPAPDAPLLNALALATRDGRIARDEAIGIAIVMFGAGGESTAALIGSTLRVLAEDPALADRLRADPTLVPRFVEEVVRLEPPFNFHYRAVRRDCSLGGYDLAEGDRLMLLWASANRDPAVLDDPDLLRLDRKHPKKHMSFGRGAHFCIGAPLARLEARVVVEEILAATKHVAPDRPERGRPAWARYAKSIFIRRLEGLDLVAERR
ncbi:MAG: cytochrome P450 [bacterium]|nr:cytochrome P450 [bacterium]